MNPRADQRGHMPFRRGPVAQLPVIVQSQRRARCPSARGSDDSLLDRREPAPIGVGSCLSVVVPSPSSPYSLFPRVERAALERQGV